MRINSLIYKIRYLLISFLPNKIRRAIFNVLGYYSILYFLDFLINTINNYYSNRIIDIFLNIVFAFKHYTIDYPVTIIENKVQSNLIAVILWFIILCIISYFTKMKSKETKQSLIIILLIYVAWNI